jgi:hypothetical protein
VVEKILSEFLRNTATHWHVGPFRGDRGEWSIR